MAHSTHQFGRLKKLVASVAVLALTELVLWGVGADKASAHISAGVVAGIGGACAIFVGWVLLPGTSYLWSRLTFNGRHTRLRLTDIETMLRDMSATLPAEQADTRGAENKKKANALGRLYIEGDIAVTALGGGKNPERRKAVEAWIIQCETEVVEVLDVAALARLRAHRFRSGHSIVGSTGEYRTAEGYLDWIKVEMGYLGEPFGDQGFNDY